jgi:hypothetical protein
MPRYYFHLEDGRCLLDDNGLDLPDIVAAQDEALRTSGNLLRGEALEEPEPALVRLL